MAYAILGSPNPQFIDSSGAPYASGTVTTLDPADGSSVKDCFPTATDADAGTNAVSGDITLDASGRVSTGYWGKDGEDYKVVIKDVNAATILTMDNIKLPLKSRRALVTFTSADATPTVAEGNIFRLNDTTITDFDDGQVGDVIMVYGPISGKIQITNGASILLQDGLDVRIGVADTILFAMFADQVWHEISRSMNNSGTLFETVTATNVIAESESGTTYFLNLAGGFTSTLPAPAAGANFKFIVKTAPTTAYIITTNGGANVIYGNLLDIVGELVAVVAQDTVNFVASTALVGDTAEFTSDGTNWYCKLRSGANGGITVAAT